MQRIINWDEFFLRHAYLTALKSRDIYTKIGSVLVRDKQIVSQGFNGICKGVYDDIEERHERPEKYNFYCHSEVNCFYQAAKHGISTNNTTLYTFAKSCLNCTMGIIQSGVKEVVLHRQWEDALIGLNHKKWLDSFKYSDIMFEESGIKVFYFDKKLGIVALIDGKEIEV
jgi:dCMP deaminase